MEEIENVEPKPKRRKKGRPKKPKVKQSIVTIRKREKTLHARERKYDFLKYHKIVFDQALIKNPSLKMLDLELLLFLYSEGVFTKTDMNNYALILPFSKFRLTKYLNKGYIIKWRDEKNKRVNLYALSDKTKKMINLMYRQLNEEAPLSENPLFDKFVRTGNNKQKYYMVGVKRINKDIFKAKEKEAKMAKLKNIYN